MCYECKICCKDYSSYQSLWNHNKKFHNINIITSINMPKLPIVGINTLKKTNDLNESLIIP
jgi:hypothetical protein